MRVFLTRTTFNADETKLTMNYTTLDSVTINTVRRRKHSTTATRSGKPGGAIFRSWPRPGELLMDVFVVPTDLVEKPSPHLTLAKDVAPRRPLARGPQETQGGFTQSLILASFHSS